VRVREGKGKLTWFGPMRGGIDTKFRLCLVAANPLAGDRLGPSQL